MSTTGTWLPAPVNDPKPDGNPWLPGSYQLLVEQPAFRRPPNAQQAPVSTDTLENILSHVSAGMAKYLFLDEIIAGDAVLVVHDWPIIDVDDRMWFDTENDPPTIEVEVRRLQTFVDHQRKMVADLGVIEPTLATRPLAVGDCFASLLLDTEPDSIVNAGLIALYGGLRHVLEVESVLSALDSTGRLRLIASPPVESWPPGPLLDVTWDAQDASQAAYFAAATRSVVPPARRRLLLADDRAAVDREVVDAARDEAFGITPAAAEDRFAVQDLDAGDEA